MGEGVPFSSRSHVLFSEDFLELVHLYFVHVYVQPNGPEELSLFLQHINNIRPSIHFIIEVKDNGKIPLIDVLVVKDSGRIMIEVYCNL